MKSSPEETNYQLDDASLIDTLEDSLTNESEIENVDSDSTRYCIDPVGNGCSHIMGGGSLLNRYKGRRLG